MAEVVLRVAGRTYRLACRDGEETALEGAGLAVDARASQLAGALGSVSESRLLLMTALSFAGQPADAPAMAAQAAAVPDAALHALADQLESLAVHLEKLAASA